MLKIKVTYPSKSEESRVLELMARQSVPCADKVVSAEQILKARQTADQVYVDEKIKNYVLDLVIATRTPQDYGLETLKPWIQYGASPRAAIFMVQAAKAYAFLAGRGYVTPEDIKAVGLSVMRHRLLLTYEAEAENIDAETVLKTVFEAIEVP